MENIEIINALKTIIKLSEIHDINTFKIRALSNALYSLERAGKKLQECSLEELEEINGVGKSIATQIEQLVRTGTCDQLEKLSAETPSGVLEISRLPGLGATKVRTLWRELGIDSIEMLKRFIEEGKLSEVKGFGKKTEKNIGEALAYYLEQRGKVLFPAGQALAHTLLVTLRKEFPESRWEITGQVRRKCQVIDQIELLGIRKKQSALQWLKSNPEVEFQPKESSPYILRALLKENGLPIWIRLADENEFETEWFRTTGDAAHVALVTDLAGTESTGGSEADIYTAAGLPLLPPECRESLTEITSPGLRTESLIHYDDIAGIVHAHSTWSDGRSSLRDMSESAMEKGYGYLGITDHSKSSFFYANGLFENRIRDQHAEIKALNEEFENFRIFKGIECDILPDGSLDYSPEILDSFDFVICSVHSVLNMDQATATRRLLKAISNPYTTILGHMTGRLLLRRQGYPVSMEHIIEACAEHNVAIELNANPNRLDVDWTWIPKIIESGVMISINPDAHSVEGYSDVTYGVDQARKAMVNKHQNLTSMSASALEEYFLKRKEKALSHA